MHIVVARLAGLESIKALVTTNLSLSICTHTTHLHVHTYMHAHMHTHSLPSLTLGNGTVKYSVEMGVK